jgi:hypothetical protein
VLAEVGGQRRAEQLTRAVAGDVEQGRPVRAEHDRTDRGQGLRGLRRVGGHPFQRLEVGLQAAALGVARDPFDPYTVEDLAGTDHDLRQLTVRQVDDEVVDDHRPVLLHDLDRVDVGADGAQGRRDGPERAGAVGQGHAHQEHTDIIAHRALPAHFGPQG